MAPRTIEQFDKIRQQSRSNIMEAALELFGSYGYHATSVSKIAKAADISKGLMYNYFDSKEDLLHAIIIENLEENEEWWNDIVEATIPPFEKLKLTVEKSIEVVQKDTHHWRLLTSLAFQPEIMKGLENVLGQKQGEVMGQLVAIFAELGWEEPLKEAFFYGAFMDGMFLHYLQMADAYPLEDMKNYLLKRYEN